MREYSQITFSYRRTRASLTEDSAEERDRCQDTYGARLFASLFIGKEEVLDRLVV